MIRDVLPPESAFSRAVYTEIRPAIPRSQWPSDAVRATFVVAPDGLSMEAVFDDLPPAAAAAAAQVVHRAGVDLVLKSPTAYYAAVVVRIRRWRDTFLYALVPVMFAIPLMAALGDSAMRLCIALFAVNVLALLASHAWLLQGRSRMREQRFVAQIPTPGLRIRVPQGTPRHPQG